MSRRWSFFYDVFLKFDAPVQEHAFVLRCIPSSFPGQEITDVTMELDPPTSCVCHQDSFGNLLQIGRISQPHDHFRYTVRGSACLDLTHRVPEPCLPICRYPSAYTTPSPALLEYLERLYLSENPAQRTWALVEAVQDRMQYLPEVTRPSTTAAEAFEAGQGVCQDCAHLHLTLARQSGLCARYVNGLPEGEGASHAWCEVWLDGVWTGVDPTRGKWTDEGYIRFGVGRDFGDCPMERGVFLGQVQQRQTVFMRVCAEK